MGSCSVLFLVSLLVVAFGVQALAAKSASPLLTEIVAEAPGTADKDLTECWKAVMLTPRSCAHDIHEILVTGKVHISKECCVKLAMVGDKCVIEVFSHLPSGKSILPIVKRICGLITPVP